MDFRKFARRAGVSVDTVRFYVRKGLLQPATSKGGSNGYQEFSEEDVRLMGSIRVGQALGLSLQEIRELVDQGRAATRDGAVAAAALRDIQQRLEVRSAELAAMSAFVAAKLAWLESPRRGARPALSDFVAPAK